MQKLLGQTSRIVVPGKGALVKKGGVWLRELEVLEGGVAVRHDAPLIPDLRAEGWTNSEEQDILEEWFAGTARPNTASHIGLFTTTPADDATGGVEATGGSYARQAYALNGTNWGGSAAGAPATIDNLVAVNFPAATANWGTVASWGYFTAVTAGTLLFFAVLDTAKAINNGDTASMAIGALTAQLGDPGDTY